MTRYSLWLRWKAGKLTEKEYLIALNQHLGQVIDKIRDERKQINERLWSN